jgi:hypothetical protein
MTARATVIASAFLLLLPRCAPTDRPDDTRPGGSAGPVSAEPVNPTPAGTDPAAAGAVEFVSRSHGYRVAHPPDWEPVPSDDYVLNLVPRGRGGAGGGWKAAAVSVDVPDLPPHIPGWIPLGMVVNGYVDDLRDKYPGLRAGEPAPTTLAGRKARRVRSTWTAADGTPHVEEAVLTTRGDRVYILRLTAAADDEPHARVAYDAVLNSLRWLD